MAKLKEMSREVTYRLDLSQDELDVLAVCLGNRTGPDAGYGKIAHDLFHLVNPNKVKAITAAGTWSFRGV